MTEQEWQEAVDPRPMLRWLGSRIGTSEATRFAHCCCERVRAFMHDPRIRQAMEVLKHAATEGIAKSVIDVAAEEAQQAAWLAVRVHCVPILGEEEFNRQIRMLRTGPDPFEQMACEYPVYLTAEAVKCSLLCMSDPRSAEFASRYAAEAVARSSADVDEARAREWASQAALLRQIAGSAAASCVSADAEPSAAPDPAM